jgi:uncharacterized membrane protein
MIRRLRKYFVTGILVVTPIVLTVFIFWKIFNGLDNVVLNLSNNLLAFLGIQPYHGKIPGLGIIVMILVILIAGIIARNYFGNKLFKLGDWLVTQIPLISKIYIAIRQIFEAIFSEKREVFKQAVMFEYPRKGTHSIGFVTQDTRGEVQDKLDEDVFSVFLPTTPNPTSGYLIFVPKKDAVILEMSIEDALKLIISGGAINPDSQQDQEFSLDDLFPFKRKKKKKLTKILSHSRDSQEK